MDGFLDRLAKLKRMMKGATAFGFALMDAPPERRAAAFREMLEELDQGVSRDQALLAAYDYKIEIPDTAHEEQMRLVDERKARKAKAAAARAEAKRKEARKMAFEAWEKTQGI